MGVSDKAKNTAQKATGKAEESMGRATGDRSLEAEGHADQTAADVKQAGEKLKDAARPD